MRTNLSAPILKIIHVLKGTKTTKPTKPAASDLPVPAEGVRNIKSMWEKGNVFSSPTASGTPNKVSRGLLSFNFGGWGFAALFVCLFWNHIANYKSSEESVNLTFFCNDHKSQLRENAFLRLVGYAGCSGHSPPQVYH